MAQKQKAEIEQLPLLVYPSTETTIAVAPDDDYNGAHRYVFRNSLGHVDGKPKYDGSSQEIQFVKKDKDGNITPGLQNEQVLLALIDRTKKLNEVFPCRQNSLAITKLEEALHWFEDRVKDRVARDVMGKLEK